MSLKISTRGRGGATIIKLKGDLTVPECRQLPTYVKDQLAAGKKRFAVSLEKVNRIDHDGLGALAQSYTSVKRENGGMKLFGPNEDVLIGLRRVNLHEAIGAYPRRKDALKALGCRAGLFGWF